MTTDPPKVLLADDDPAIRPLITAIGKRHGFVCDTAEDGEVALEKIRSVQSDVVMLHLMMPKVNGYQVIEAGEHMIGHSERERYGPTRRKSRAIPRPRT